MGTTQGGVIWWQLESCRRFSHCWEQFPKQRKERNTLASPLTLFVITHQCLTVANSGQKPAGNSTWEMPFARVRPLTTQNRAKKGQGEDVKPKWQMNGSVTFQGQFYSISSTLHFLCLLPILAVFLEFCSVSSSMPGLEHRRPVRYQLCPSKS